MSSHEYILYDPDGRGLLIAATYRILRNNDVAGWYYGYTGKGQYRQSYFQIVRNATLKPVHHYAGGTPCQWERDHLQAESELEGALVVPGELVQVLEDIQGDFEQGWLVRDDRSGDYRLNGDRLREMQLEEDDCYSRSLDVDWSLLELLAAHWSLVTPLPQDAQGFQDKEQ